jgi:selenoprotein W-related protein
LATAIVDQFRQGVGKGHAITEIVLIPSGGGCFEVIADDKLIYSKKATGKHADVAEVVKGISTLGKTA